MGFIIERGKHPRTTAAPLVLEVTPELTIKYYSRENIVAQLRVADLQREFQCGQQARRSSKVVLDIAKIRERQAAVGSLYVPPSPHKEESVRPGTGQLRSLMRNMREDSPLQPPIRELDAAQARLAAIKAMHAPHDFSKDVRVGSAKSGGSTTAVVAAHPPKLPDYGSPTLSEGQKKIRLPWHIKPPAYESK